MYFIIVTIVELNMCLFVRKSNRW